MTLLLRYAASASFVAPSPSVSLFVVRHSSNVGHLHTFLDNLMQPAGPVRIDNALAQYGYCMRKDARKFCLSNDVMIHRPGRGPVKAFTGHPKADPRSIFVNGQALEYAGLPLHIALHKPPGYVVSLSPHEGPTVFDLLPDLVLTCKPECQPVGRLDKDASGLLVFTQSGQLSSYLTSPARSVPKEYLVALDRPLSRDGREARQFREGGLRLADGTVAAPAGLVPHSVYSNVARITLTQGRFHQLRRMAAAVGYTVTGIHRSRIAGLRLVPSKTVDEAAAGNDSTGPGARQDALLKGKDRTACQASCGPGEVRLNEGEWALLTRQQVAALIGLPVDDSGPVPRERELD